MRSPWAGAPHTAIARVSVIKHGLLLKPTRCAGRWRGWATTALPLPSSRPSTWRSSSSGVQRRHAGTVWGLDMDSTATAPSVARQPPHQTPANAAAERGGETRHQPGPCPPATSPPTWRPTCHLAAASAWVLAPLPQGPLHPAVQSHVCAAGLPAAAAAGGALCHLGRPQASVRAGRGCRHLAMGPGSYTMSPSMWAAGGAVAHTATLWWHLCSLSPECTHGLPGLASLTHTMPPSPPLVVPRPPHRGAISLIMCQVVVTDEAVVGHSPLVAAQASVVWCCAAASLREPNQAGKAPAACVLTCRRLVGDLSGSAGSTARASRFMPWSDRAH